MANQKKISDKFKSQKHCGNIEEKETLEGRKGVSKMFYLGDRSNQRLIGVMPYIKGVITLALLKYSEIDFGVGAGAVRTLEEQQKKINDGLSRTLNSYHLPQNAILPDGVKYSHAVDLYPSGYKRIGDIPDEAWIEVSRSLDLATRDLSDSENINCMMKVEHGMSWGRIIRKSGDNFESKLGWDCPHHQWKFKVISYS